MLDRTSDWIEDEYEIEAKKQDAEYEAELQAFKREISVILEQKYERATQGTSNNSRNNAKGNTAQ